MSRTSLAVTLCAALLLLSTIPAPHQAAQANLAAARLLANVDVPGANGIKYPDIFGKDNLVHVDATPGDYQDGGVATYWQKQDTATSFPGGTPLGDAGGQADYRNIAVTAGPDNAVYVAWIDQDTKGTYIRRKPVGGDWGPTNTIIRDSKFRVYIDLAVSTNNVIFAVWSQEGKYRLRRSTDNGAGWTDTATIAPNLTALNRPIIASGPNGAVAVAYGDNLGLIHVGIWDGSSFVDSVVRTPGSGQYFADPTVSISGNGTIYAAWRNVGGGIYYGERKPDGVWGTSKVANGESYGTVSIAADAANNLHLFWNNDQSGQYEMWYAFKPPTSDWQGPVGIPGNANLLANNRAATTLGPVNSYGHAIVEAFSGNNVTARYFLVESQGAPPTAAVDAVPVIEGETITYTNKTNVNVTFKNVTGAPTQIRTHWGAAPTDADQWRTFVPTGTLTVDGPSGIGTICSPQTLYTQVKNQNNTVSSPAQKDSITFDRAVQANVQVTNPNIAGDTITYTPLGTNDSATEGSGASDGDPNFTRVQQFYLGIVDNGDCSGLGTFVVEGGLTAAVPPGGFSNAIPLPGTSDPGPRDVKITVTDKLSNTFTMTKTLIYDPSDTNPSSIVNNTEGLPVLATSPVSPTVSADSANSVIRTLSFSNISVKDNLYNPDGDPNTGDGYWGVWIANSRSDNGPDDPNLVWFPIRVPSHSASFSLQWSLYSGLNYGLATNKSGNYFVYVRFLDGAGNPSQAAIKTTVTLAPGYSLPALRLPLVAAR